MINLQNKSNRNRIGMKTLYELEYELHTSSKLLYSMVSTPDGLAKWFADKVDVSGNIFTFKWNDSLLKAEMISKKLNEFVRYRWLESEPEVFFEFKILHQELSGSVALIICDYALPDEKEDSISLWEDSIKKLKRAIGL